jgi:hypothetical protein
MDFCLFYMNFPVSVGHDLYRTRFRDAFLFFCFLFHELEEGKGETKTQRRRNSEITVTVRKLPSFEASRPSSIKSPTFKLQLRNNQRSDFLRMIAQNEAEYQIYLCVYGHVD